ncbi:dihydrofolate reductase family protein [Actinocrispum sp. NPDC049592]|uniref:dihydrofolate reductase family protein n=1 Tax=Actinocrispum sp. NPDC049592 TaxID=3154835 RepID=UPI00344137B3
MRKVIVSTYMTLDGKVDHLQEWAAPYDSGPLAQYHSDLLAGSDGLLLGRRTYELFAAIWPARTLGYASKINSMAKHVASATVTELSWENSQLVGGGDVAEGVAKLKQEPGQDLVVYGGTTLIRTLHEHDLVDEYRFLLHPILLGKGGNLFGDSDRVNLDLAGTSEITPGVILLTYRPAGHEVRRIGER